jgi:hypothetical protein
MPTQDVVEHLDGSLDTSGMAHGSLTGVGRPSDTKWPRIATA